MIDNTKRKFSRYFERDDNNQKNTENNNSHEKSSISHKEDFSHRKENFKSDFNRSVSPRKQNVERSQFNHFNKKDDRKTEFNSQSDNLMPRRNRQNNRRPNNQRHNDYPDNKMHKMDFGRQGFKPRINERPRYPGKLTVCTLSGTNEVGRNSNFIQLDNDILMIDCGFSFPEQELLGIDYLIPNISYLKRNKSKIKGLIITHGHLDHTGALQYVLPELDFPPIYAGRFAIALIKEKLAEVGLDKKVKFIPVDRGQSISFGQFKVKFIGVTHSIPNSFSIFVESPKGNVFFSGDYKIDLEPANEPETDYSELKALNGKVDLALMESTNAYAQGKAKSETEIASNLEDIIKSWHGRIIVASFSSLVSRLYSLMKIAMAGNRKVVLAGRSLRTTIQIAREQGYIDVPDNLLISDREMKKYSDDQLLFLSTGSQGERYSALNRISLGEHKFLRIKEGDLVIMSSSDIPDNIVQIQHMTDRLIKQGAELIKNNMMEVHASGHGLSMDMQMMYDMIKPETVIPIHGSMTMRYQNKKNFVNWGMKEDRVLLTEDGVVWIKEGDKWVKGESVESKPILIDGLGVGDIGDIVIKDRQQLAEFGMVTVVVNLSSKNGRIVGKPRFISRGFVYVKASQELFDQLEQLVYDIHQDWLDSQRNNKRKEYSTFREELEKGLQKYILKKTEREPMILPVII